MEPAPTSYRPLAPDTALRAPRPAGLEGRDALVIGSGPNGLAAAITLAREGHRVGVVEGAPTIGGGVRTAELTLPGFHHDPCSSIYPFAIASPFFETLPLSALGVRWIHSPAVLAHPLDDGSAVMLERDVDETARGLGAEGDAYRRLFGPVVDDWPRLQASILGPVRWPRHPYALARFASRALRSARAVARAHLAGPRSRALLAGLAAHGMLRLDRSPSGGIGLVLGALGHAVGWPLSAGGAQRVADALAAHLRDLGGHVVTDQPVTSVDELPPSRVLLCDLAPGPLLRVAGHRFTDRYRAALGRYRHTMAAFKMDWALDGPIPWTAPECTRAATVHLGGSFEEIARSEEEAAGGRAPARPFVLLAQPTLFDASRAPAGRHIAWAYCHVPVHCPIDMAPRIEQQIERFAPGFRERILARSALAPVDLERYNPNYVGGDIGTGSQDLWQFLRRPTWTWYRTPARGIYLCSAATPPGVGVHGMCGYLAARLALERELGG